MSVRRSDVNSMNIRPSRPNRLGRSSGFTLIELLIIMVILGILATIIIFAVQSMEGESAVASCKADFKTVETAEETYRGQVGSPATSFPQLMGTATGLTGATVGPWLKDTPLSNHYSIVFDLTAGKVGNVMVAAGTHLAADGNANCQYAG